MKSVYGAFCSRHNDALQLYKALLKSDVTFQEFIKVSIMVHDRRKSFLSYCSTHYLYFCISQVLNDKGLY